MDTPESARDPATSEAEAALPEAAARRLHRSSFSSALTIPEFAACQHLGIHPVGLVQGFCVMRWTWNAVAARTFGAGFGGGNWKSPGHRRLSSYNCPHGRYMMSAEHPIFGFNDELTYMEQAWATGFGQAHARMVAEAAEAGAHGIIGVIDATQSLIASDVREFHLLGTAVVLDGRPPPAIWTTFLAGQRLAKLFEAGMVPLSVVGAFAAVSVWPVCVTEMLESGRGDGFGIINANEEITQLSDAHMGARRVARDQARNQLGEDGLHGADLQVQEGRLGTQMLITASLQGTRIRRSRNVEPLPVPVPTVRLS